MLDLNLIREDSMSVRARLADRQVDPSLVDDVLRFDTERRVLRSELDGLMAQRKALAGAIGRAAPTDAPALKEAARALNGEVRTTEEALRACEGALQAAASALPNLPHPTVPVGPDSGANVVERVVGEYRRFPFPARPHWEVGAELGGLDIERGVKLGGSRFYLLRGDLALLELALINFMVDRHVDRGYTLVIPPFLVGPAAMYGCGQLPKFQDGLYHCEVDDLYLVPTAESALAGMHAGEIFAEDELPHWYAGYTPCFRREAGAAGQDTRGILRVHQFNKVELFKFCTPEASYAELETLVADAEGILQALELPYRVVALSTGDMGFAAAKTYDLEVWLPAQETYREISSCSNCEDFQARRADIRYRPAAGGRPRYVHMLNGSGLAVGRTMIALLENYQQEDGTVMVPKALRPFFGGRERLVPAGAARSLITA